MVDVGKVGMMAHFFEVRESINTADNVDGYVIFNIRGNRYRLVTVIHYAKTTPEKQTEGHVYIRSFLTHKAYDDQKMGSEVWAMSTVLANPVAMMKQGAPRVIHSYDDLERYTEELFKLTAIDEPSAYESEASNC